MPEEKKQQDAKDATLQRQLLKDYRNIVENLDYPKSESRQGVADFNKDVWLGSIIRLALTLIDENVIKKVPKTNQNKFESMAKTLQKNIENERQPQEEAYTAKALRDRYEQDLMSAARLMDEQQGLEQNIKELQLVMQHNVVQLLATQVKKQGTATLNGFDITRKWLEEKEGNIATSTRPKNRGRVANWSTIKIASKSKDSLDLMLYAGGTALQDHEAKHRGLVAYLNGQENNYKQKLEDAYTEVVKQHARDWAERYLRSKQDEQSWMKVQLGYNPQVLRLDSLLTDAPAIQLGGKVKEQNMVDFFKCLKKPKLQEHLRKAWKEAACSKLGDTELFEAIQAAEIHFPVTVTPMDYARFLTGIASFLSGLNPFSWLRPSTRHSVASHTEVAQDMLRNFAKALKEYDDYGRRKRCSTSVVSNDSKQSPRSSESLPLETFTKFLEQTGDAPMPDITREQLEGLIDQLWVEKKPQTRAEHVRQMQAAIMLAMTLRQQKQRTRLRYAITIASILVALGMSIGLIMMGMAPMIVGMALVGVLILGQLSMILGKRLLMGEWDRSGLLMRNNLIHSALNARFLVPGLVIVSMASIALALGMGPVILAVVGLVLGVCALAVGLLDPKYDHPEATLSAWMSMLVPTFTGCKTARDRMGLFLAITTERLQSLNSSPSSRADENKGVSDQTPLLQRKDLGWMQLKPYLDVKALANRVGKINVVFPKVGQPFAAKMGGNLGIQTKTDKATKLPANVQKATKFKAPLKDALNAVQGYGKNKRFAKNLTKLNGILSATALALFAWQMMPLLATAASVWAMVLLSGLVVWTTAAMLKIVGVSVPYLQETQVVMASTGAVVAGLGMLVLPMVSIPLTIAVTILMFLMAITTLSCRQAEKHVSRCTTKVLGQKPPGISLDVAPSASRSALRPGAIGDEKRSYDSEDNQPMRHD